jgi:alkylation response protein AidB-like acyl-CoA dehydrogenase
MARVAQHPARQDSLLELAKSFAARAADYDRDSSPPVQSLAEAGEAGLFALTAPREFGGAGAGLEETVEVARTLGAGDPATTLILAMTWLQHALAGRDQRWPAAVYRRVVADAVHGRGLINVLGVEPELGTPQRGGLPQTVARRTADGWRISGRKIYSTGATVLQWCVVVARTDDEEPRMGHFLVPAAAEGVRIEETWDHLGMRATCSHDLIFEDTAIPPSFALDVRAPQEWRNKSTVHMAWMGLVISAVYLGVADAARDWLVAFLKSRVPTNLGKPLATLERMQLAVGEIEALLRSSAILLSATARKADLTGDSLDPNEPGIVKHVVTENAIRAVATAVSLTGNPALSRTNRLERHWRDVLCARVHWPQGDSVLKSAASAAFAMQP